MDKDGIKNIVRWWEGGVYGRWGGVSRRSYYYDGCEGKESFNKMDEN